VAGRSDEITGTAISQGAAFIGEGGYCGPIPPSFKAYGRYNSMPKDIVGRPELLRNYTGQIGSMGMIGDTSTWGGGRVVLIADSIILEGQNEKIAAHGYPL
jgi:hypothetical protein